MKHMRILLLVIAAVAASLVTGVGSAFAWGTTGEYKGGEAVCDPAFIYAKPPVMRPVQPSSIGSTSLLNGSQRIAFRAHLARWNGSRWVTVASGSWKAKDIALSGDYSVSFSDDSFYDYATGTVGGTTAFRIGLTGGYYYKVWYDLYWFAIPGTNVGSGGLPVWAVGHIDRRANVYDLGYHRNCRY